MPDDRNSNWQKKIGALVRAAPKPVVPAKAARFEIGLQQKPGASRDAGKELTPASADNANPALDDTTNATSPSEGESLKNTVGMPVRLVPIAEVRVSPGLAPCNKRNVSLLAQSTRVKPILVIDTPTGPLLVGDLHWLEAARARGQSHVECLFTGQDEIDARLAEIVEIMHHAGLPVLDTAPLVEEWVKTWGRANDSGQVVQELTVGRPHGGIAQAARVLCVPGKTEEARRKSIERAMKIAEICPEAKDEAKRLGLEDNQSALLAIANVTPEEQVAKAQERAARKRRRRHKQTITSDHVKEGTSPPVSTEEDGAHPRASPEEVEGQETEFERLTAAWAAASNAVRQRFVIEVVEQFGRSNVAA